MLQGLYTGLSALKANRIALDITSNNLANQNTEGYVKQRVNFTTNPVREVSNAGNTILSATGTHIQSVQRIQDSFLYKRLQNASQDFNFNNEQLKSLTEIDEQLQNPTFTNLYDNMFEAMGRYAESPHNITLKRLAEMSAKETQKRADQIQEVFNKVRTKNENEINELNKTITPYKENLEKLNLEIKVRESSNEFSTDKTYANNLRDKRDLLSNKIKINEAKINGLNSSNDNIKKIQNIFKESFDESYTNISGFLSSPMSGEDANKLIEQEDKIRGSLKDNFVELKAYREISELQTGTTKSMFDTLQNKRDNQSKVNEDEEMVNLMKFQKAYEANAIVIRTYDEMLKTTLDIKR